MESNVLAYHDMFDALKSGDDSRLKKAVEELANNKSAPLTELQDINLAIISLITGKGSEDMQAAIARNNLSLGDILIKVLFRIIKRKLTSIPFSTL